MTFYQILYLPAVFIPMTPAKLCVQNLIQKHFGDDWRQLELLSYYRDVIDRQKECNRAEIPTDGGNCENKISQENAFI